jgi:hypothetical protein
MVQQLLPLLPEPTRFTFLVALAGSLLGAGLWLTGARFSRRLITLLGVAVGAGLGMAMPQWFGWTVHPMACAVGGAVLCGAAGFGLHKLWVGVGLGMVLACWATLATWLAFSGNEPWHWPAATETVLEYAAAVWAAIPELVRLYLPYSAGTAMISGISATLLWPRVGVVLLYSCAGVSLLVGMGLAAIEAGQPEWLELLPADTWGQLLTLLGLVAFGAVMQWQLQPAAPSAPAAGGDTDKTKD